MQTRCPRCRTTFRVRADQLAAAAGKVRCGACQSVFDARMYRLGAPAANPPPAAAMPAPRPTRLPDLDFATRHPAPQPSGWSTMAWTALNFVLILLLVGQYAWHHRGTFAAQPALRPAMEGLCVVARCTLPPWRDIAALELTSRNVQSHPRFDKALLVDATFINHAPLAQPYPDLQVTFLDTEERPIASRRFTPAEYLSPPTHAPLAPGAEAHAVLEILDPGDRAFGYEFAFR